MICPGLTHPDTNGISGLFLGSELTATQACQRSACRHEQMNKHCATAHPLRNNAGEHVHTGTQYFGYILSEWSGWHPQCTHTDLWESGGQILLKDKCDYTSFNSRTWSKFACSFIISCEPLRLFVVFDDLRSTLLLLFWGKSPLLGCVSSIAGPSWKAKISYPWWSTSFNNFYYLPFL